MKVLILTEEQYPYVVGGSLTINRLIEQYFNEKKVDYDIFCTRWLPGSKYPNKKIKALSIPYVKIKNKYLRQVFRVPYILSWIILTTLYLVSHKKRYDLIFVEENTFSAYYSLFLRKLFGIKICLNDQTPGDLSAIQKKLGLPSFVVGSLENAINNFRKRCDFIIYSSRDACQKYVRLNKNSEFIPNFIDLSELTSKKRSTKPVNLGFTGRVCFDKRVDLMIRTIGSFPELNLILVGEGPKGEEEQLRKLVKDLNLKNVHFRGFTRDIDKALDEIDILLMLWEKESFGISALEAMAKGIPVIAADVQEMHHFIGETGAGIVLKAVDESHLKNAISRLVKDKKLYFKLSTKSKEVAKQYEYHKILEQYLRIFERLSVSK